MKFFTNKSIWSKIIIALIIVLVFEFIVAKPSLGSDVDKMEFGGKLLAPVISLGVTLADAGVQVMQSSIMGTNESLIHIDTSSTWWTIFKNLVKVVVFAAAVVATFASWGILGGVVAGAALLVFGDTASALYSSAMDNTLNGIKNSVVGYDKDRLPDDLYLPTYSISPEEIFQGKILLFNVDFFGKGKTIQEKKDSEGNTDYYYYINDNNEEVKTSPQDIGQDLSETISRWYVALRNIGLVMMLIILLYVGIRMLLSTLASDKAKYKQMLTDWFMGIVILFTIHYVMVFAVTIVNGITKVVSSSVESNAFTVVMEDKDNKISKVLEEGGEDMKAFIDESTGKKVISWPTNLMGSLRLRAQLANWGSEYIGYAICFIVLAIFTGFFILTYMKRVLYMAFLTLMAPLVAVTYPIDKLSDGSAQGFNKWFKEYIFNLLIQPMHLLLYYVLITSAFDLAGKNVIYALVAMGFMIPAEKILRSFFGFDKSATAPSMATGAAVGMGLAQLMKPKPPKLAGGKKAISGNSSNGRDSSDDGGKIRTPSTSFNTEAVLANSVQNKEYEERQKAIDKLRKEDSSQEAQAYLDKEQAKLDADRIKDKELKSNMVNDGQLQLDANQPIGKQVGMQEDQGLSKTVLKKPTIKQRAKRYTAAKGAQAARAIKKSARDLPGNAFRASGRVLGAGAGVALGLAGGIAQGDLGKAAAYGVGGATLGSAVGKGTGEILANPVDSGMNKIAEKVGWSEETPKQAFDRVNNSKQYENIVNYEEMQKSKKQNKQYLKETYGNTKEGKEKVKEMLKEGGAFEQMYSNGVTNIKDMVTIQNMKDENMINNYKEGIAIAKSSEEVGKEYKGLNAQKWNNEWKRRYTKNGLDEEQSQKAADATMARIESFNKIKKKL